MQIHQLPRRFVRLSFLITDEHKRMLFLRFYKRKMWFDPGGRMVKGVDDKTVLAEKIKKDLGVTLLQESLVKVANFAAPAYDKPEGTMFEIRCYSGNFEGTLGANNRVRELIWVNSNHPELLKPHGESLITDGGRGLIQNLCLTGFVS